MLVKHDQAPGEGKPGEESQEGGSKRGRDLTLAAIFKYLTVLVREPSPRKEQENRYGRAGRICQVVGRET